MKILFICHRIPFPPNKGEKIRSYNIVKHLAQNHDIHLATLIDDPVDFQHIESLSGMVKLIHYDTIRPSWKKALSAFALFINKPISVAYFYSRKLQVEIDSLLLKKKFDVIFCSSSPMAEYLFRSKASQPISFPASQLPGLQASRPLLIMDLIDVDSLKWKEYADRHTRPMKWVYAQESKNLRRYEKQVADLFDHLLLVSEAEKSLLARYVRNGNISSMPNGVDYEHFTPSFQSSIQKKGPAVVFTGVMDYWANIEGVVWFANSVFPRIRAQHPAAEFYIVGNQPAAAVRNLVQAQSGISVTGFVSDVRDYISAADVCVAPLHIARGIQNKVLEAMAMGKAVVCTPQAADGIQAIPGKDIIAAGSAEEFAVEVSRLIEDKRRAESFGASARKCVEAHYLWKKNLELLDSIIMEGVRTARDD
jgi:sugar transferase (PEP-CTERM/EpsH1 system associated)